MSCKTAIICICSQSVDSITQRIEKCENRRHIVLFVCFQTIHDLKYISRPFSFMTRSMSSALAIYLVALSASQNSVCSRHASDIEPPLLVPLLRSVRQHYLYPSSLNLPQEEIDPDSNQHHQLLHKMWYLTCSSCHRAYISRPLA